MLSGVVETTVTQCAYVDGYSCATLILFPMILISWAILQYCLHSAAATSSYLRVLAGAV